MNKKSIILLKIIVYIFVFCLFYYTLSVKYKRILRLDQIECIYNAILLTFATFLLEKISWLAKLMGIKIRNWRIR